MRRYTNEYKVRLVVTEDGKMFFGEVVYESFCIIIDSVDKVTIDSNGSVYLSPIPDKITLPRSLVRDIKDFCPILYSMKETF